MSDGPLVLLVEDEAQMRRFLRAALTSRGYRLVEAEKGAEAVPLTTSHNPELVLLDLGLPDVDGLEVTKRLREFSTVPIIVLSARHAEQAKVQALDAGADDYVTKPFGMDELLARIRAAMRRGTPATEEPVIATEAFTVDLAARRVTRDGADVRLTPTEWHLLEVLVRHPGKLVSQRQLLQEVWGPRYERETNYLRVYLAQLRAKLEPDPSRPRHLLTEPGMGYRFQP